MRMRDLAAAALAAALMSSSASAGAEPADAGAAASASAALRVDAIVLAQNDAGGGTRPAELEPRYRPVEPEPEGWYNSDYFFALTRTVAGSTLVPAAKLPLYVLTFPFDVALLPFAAIGGLFG